ncbi:aminotransferase [Rhizobium sp. BE258]|jgi:fructoselysine-6-P-deglycase FrlB-like protein|uniref:SIS domain-containing protein n=1 Tax=Rhizobium sp. BE258 TaxID=2817722 RepID=UPI002861BD9B|nr:aminotransferase [Rhizobium sp. BE258]MDR7144753.1 fructoselysine-6-P-deglycase FrlB-like protein [Rhizobium sp. BE258]
MSADNIPESLKALDREMERQHSDALASYEGARQLAQDVAARLKKSRKLLMLGMGASHAVGRAVEPLYRAMGVATFALPLSEQLGAPVHLEGWTSIVTSQSGESAEVIRWFNESCVDTSDIFGMTLGQGSSLSKRVLSFMGAGGMETAFAATRSLTVTFALHLAILEQLGLNPAQALAALKQPEFPDVSEAIARFQDVNAIVASGRLLNGVAEALALGLTELSRVPSFALEGGQLRHGPMEMLGSTIGVVLFRGADPTANLVTAMASSVVEAGSPLVIFDSSGLPPVEGAVTVPFKTAGGMAAIFAILPAAQRFMIGFAAGRVENAGTPLRSSKITRSE